MNELLSQHSAQNLTHPLGVPVTLPIMSLKTILAESLTTHCWQLCITYRYSCSERRATTLARLTFSGIKDNARITGTIKIGNIAANDRCSSTNAPEEAPMYA